MFRILLVLVGLSIPSFSQDFQSQIDELKAGINQQAETLRAQTQTISHLEQLIAHDHRTQPTFRKILPADKILGASIIFAMMCAYAVFVDTGSVVLTFGTFASYLYTFYGFLKIVRNNATVAGNSSLVAKATRD